MPRKNFHKEPLTWFVVLDSKHGSIWARRGQSDLPEWQFDLHPAELVHHEQATTAHESATSQRHRVEARTTARRRKALAFADRVASMLDDAVARNEVDGLVLVARDRMLGELRHAMSPRTRARVVQETPSILTGLRPSALARRLATVDHLRNLGESHVN